MEFFTRLGPFWTLGIIANLALTGLAIWWIVRSMRGRDSVPGSSRPGSEKPRPHD